MLNPHDCALVAYQTITDYFEQNNWEIRKTATERLVNAAFQGRNHRHQIAVRVDHQAPVILASVIPEVYVPEPQHQAMMELLTILNWSLIIGRWEMDLADGEVRFCGGLPYGAKGVDPEALAYTFEMLFSTADRFMPAVLDVMAGRADALEAFEKACQPPTPPLSILDGSDTLGEIADDPSDYLS